MSKVITKSILYFFNMPAKGSWRSRNVRSVLQLVYRYRFRSSDNVSIGHGSSSGSKVPGNIGYGFNPMHPGLQMYSTNGGAWNNLEANKVKVTKDEMVRAPEPDPSRFNFSTWAKWMLGSFLSILLPFWKQKWEKLKMIEGQTEMMIQEVETVVNVIEKAATMAEHISSEIAQKLPENGKLKKAALLVEHVSKVAAHDAHLTEDIMHKVDELKHDFDELETMIEPANLQLKSSNNIK
ncbi:uncharacterized protein LOC126660538 [Mercurialis annua]|uniref:uncharacterized protein LOC126660538 n=1 Tax=Mercurialis annua TaxID=3986 RepID=UPI00215F5BB6|nr:uncharacterized protein LOC126660538 [Mercurialis annua]